MFFHSFRLKVGVVYLIADAQRWNEAAFGANASGAKSKSKSAMNRRTESLLLKVRPSDASQLISVRAIGLFKESLEQDNDFWNQWPTNNYFFTYNGLVSSASNKSKKYADFSILAVPRTGKSFVIPTPSPNTEAQT